MEELKMCRKCETVKPINLFKRRARNKSGYDSRCLDCCNSYQAAWRDENQERIQEYKEKYSAESKANPVAHSAKLRAAHLKNYGLTPELYASMLESQGGVCVTCKMPDSAGRNLAVDHDHSCCPGKKSCGQCVRSLLCTKCNQGIGQADESIERLEAWIEYLKKYGK
jgi:hypothetical protein